MAFIPWPDGAKVIYNWTSTLGDWANVFAFSKADFTFQDMTDLGNTLFAALRTNYKNFLSDQAGLHDVNVIDMRTFGALNYRTGAPTAQGLNANEILPLQESLIATLRTLGRGRSFRGRKYMAGFTEEDMSDGIWGSTLVTEVVDQLSAWKVVAQQYGWTQCIASEQLNKVPQSPANLYPISQIIVRNSTPGTQRRRVNRP